MTAEENSRVMVLLKRQVLELIYPINSVFMTLETKNPNEILGFGVWTKITNKYIYAADQTIENNGGSDYITENMMPAHNHSINITTSQNGNHSHDLYASERDGETDSGQANWFPKHSNKRTNAHCLTDDWWNFTISTNGNHTHTVTGNTGNTPTSQTQKNLPSYQSFFIWYRTA